MTWETFVGVKEVSHGKHLIGTKTVILSFIWCFGTKHNLSKNGSGLSKGLSRTEMEAESFGQEVLPLNFSGPQALPLLMLPLGMVTLQS